MRFSSSGVTAWNSLVGFKSDCNTRQLATHAHCSVQQFLTCTDVRSKISVDMPLVSSGLVSYFTWLMCVAAGTGRFVFDWWSQHSFFSKQPRHIWVTWSISWWTLCSSSLLFHEEALAVARQEVQVSSSSNVHHRRPRLPAWQRHSGGLQLPPRHFKGSLWSSKRMSSTVNTYMPLYLLCTCVIYSQESHVPVHCGR